MIGNSGQIGPYRGPTSGMIRLQQVQQAPPYTAQFLLVGGGGGGNGGGAGAGGLINSVIAIIPLAQYVITIGSGGAINTDGSDSSFDTIATAYRGLRGGAINGGNAGNGVIPQGHLGGVVTSSYQYGQCGGGGAWLQGDPNQDNLTAGSGGNGLALTISGASVYYAGGGAGGADTNLGFGANGGLGGGGGLNLANQNGVANTGGGGGGSLSGSGGTRSAGTGGSGIFIISYLGTRKGSGGTITNVGGYTIHTFTTSGTFIG